MSADPTIKILIVYNDLSFANSLRNELLTRGHANIHVTREYRRAVYDVEEFHPEVILLGNRFPEGDIGVNAFLPQLRGFNRPPEVIMIFEARPRNSFDLIHEARDNGAFAAFDAPYIYDDGIIFDTIKTASARYRYKVELQ
jgi:chemotaxis response regulator CheB